MTLIGLTGGMPSFDPRWLFASGEQGLILDPSNLATLSQDDAGATPVTADDQLVGRIADLSGNGNHLTQATTGAKPKYKTSGGRHWLLPDGINDFLAGSSFAWGSDKLTLVAGFQFSNNTVQMICSFGTTAGDVNAWDFSCPPSSVRGAAVFRRGDTGVTSGNYGDDDGWADQGSVPRDLVYTHEVDLSGASQGPENPVVRTNGATPPLVSGGTANQTGSFGTKTFSLFRRPTGTSLYGSHPFFGLIAINRLLSLPEIIQAEIWMARRAGVTLP